jgi:Zn-dependent oligopeptidase
MPAEHFPAAGLTRGRWAATLRRGGCGGLPDEVPPVIESSAPAWDEPPLDLPTPTAEEIRSLTRAAIDRANERVDAAVRSSDDAAGPSAPDAFEALFGALDDAAREVATAFGQGASQMVVASDDAVRDAAYAANEQIETWRASLPMREDLARAVDRFAERPDLGDLDDLQRRYLERWRKDVRLAGGDLPAADRAEMVRLTNRQLELMSAFSANLAKPPRITATRAELEGVPDSVLKAATPVAGDPDRFEVTINGGTSLAIAERAPNRALRERSYRAWLSRGVPENLPILEEEIEVRRQLARLAGYPSWQAYRCENLAAPDPAFANAFIEDISSRLRAVCDREVAAMTATLRAQPGADPDLVLQDWDWRYADAIQRDAIGAHPDRLSEYFELEHVLRALDELSAEVFGLRLEARPERIGWDPAVRAFDVIDAATGRVLSHLFLDVWARSGKQAGAWMELLLPGGGRHGTERPPTIQLVTNVPAHGDGPALLTALEVETLFHEFGHVMNFSVGHGRFVVNRPTWIPFDFVEGPSEFNGRWGLQPSVVSRYGRHHVTGEPIPAELLEAVERAESLNVSFEILRLLAQCRFDALVHGEHPVPVGEAQATAWSLRGLPQVEGTFLPASLTHIFAGQYDAALYGYVWSAVIRDDLLERFVDGGLLSPETGARYRETLLSVSWIDDPVAVVNAFLGRPWSIDAFLRRASGAAAA